MAAYIGRFLLLAIYYAALNFGYWFYFKPASREDYFEVNWVTTPTDLHAGLAAIILALLLSFIGAAARRTPSQLFAVVLLLSPVMPMLVLYSDRKIHGDYVFVSAALYVLIFAIIKLPQARWLSGIASNGVLPPRMLPLVMLAITGGFIATDIAIGNLANLNFDFNRVYEFRRLAEAQRGALLGYFETNLTSFFLGLGTVFAIHRRQWLIVLAFAASAVMLFGLTSNRGHFFIVLVTIAFYFIALRKHPFVWLVGGAAAVSLIAGVGYHLSPSLKFIGDFSIGRVMFIPAIGNFLFYDFFSQHLHTYWADTRLTFGLIENPYGISGPRVVFDHYYGQDLSQDVFYGNANTGFLGAGYGHAGFAGMAIYAVFVALMTRLAATFARKTNAPVAFGAFAYMFVVALFTSSDLPTLFLTHGFLLALLLTILLKSRNPVGSIRAPRPAALPVGPSGLSAASSASP